MLNTLFKYFSKVKNTSYNFIAFNLKAKHNFNIVNLKLYDYFSLRFY